MWFYSTVQEKSIFQVDSIQVTRQFRSVKHKQGYFEVANRQLSRANPERIVMPEEFKKLNSREMRKKLEKPLLMLHALDIKDENENKFKLLVLALASLY